MILFLNLCNILNSIGLVRSMFGKPQFHWKKKSKCDKKSLTGWEHPIELKCKFSGENVLLILGHGFGDDFFSNQFWQLESVRWIWLTQRMPSFVSFVINSIWFSTSKYVLCIKPVHAAILFLSCSSSLPTLQWPL